MSSAERTEFERWPGRPALTGALQGDDALAFQLHVALGDTATAWLDRPLEALQGRTPRACLRTRSGLRDLRALAARLPR